MLYLDNYSSCDCLTIAVKDGLIINNLNVTLIFGHALLYIEIIDLS